MFNIVFPKFLPISFMTWWRDNIIKKFINSKYTLIFFYLSWLSVIFLILLFSYSKGRNKPNIKRTDYRILNEARNAVETSKLSLKSKWKGERMSKGRDGDREVINIISSLCALFFSLGVSEFPADTSNHSIESKLSCLKLKSVYFKYLLCGET